MGRGNAGPRLRPANEEGRRHQRSRRRPDRRHAGVLPRAEDGVPAGVRPARRSDAGYAGRAHHDARRVRAPQPEGRSRPGHRDGRRVPDRGPAREHDRAAEDDARAVAVLARGVLHPPRRGTRGAGRGRGVPAAGPRRHAPQARRGRAAGARRREEPEGGAAGGVRPLLPRRRGRRARARDARAGRALHEGGPRPLEGEDRGAGQDELPRHRRLQARRVDAGPGDAPGPERPRERGPEVDGLQLAAVRPHPLPGDEPRVRGPRLLLRGPGLRARGAGGGPPLEGVREEPLRADPDGPQRPRRQARRPVPVPGRDEPVEGSAREVAHRARRDDRPAGARPHAAG